MSSTSRPSGRARIILITGEPGSGKSTLGVELAQVLRIPFVARDDVRGGLFFTEGAWSERPRGVPTSDQAVDVLLHLVETAASLGVSCIVEYVLRESRSHELRRLQAVAECVVLVTVSRAARSRFIRRSESDRLLNRPPVLEALGYPTIDDHVAHAVSRMDSVVSQMQTRFDLPTLEITSDSGYEPCLDEIVEFVVARHPFGA
jgi:predicted kinase